jgi:hypothetical protein
MLILNNFPWHEIEIKMVLLYNSLGNVKNALKKYKKILPLSRK